MPLTVRLVELAARAGRRHEHDERRDGNAPLDELGLHLIATPWLLLDAGTLRPAERHSVRHWRSLSRIATESVQCDKCHISREVAAPIPPSGSRSPGGPGEMFLVAIGILV